MTIQSPLGRFAAWLIGAAMLAVTLSSAAESNEALGPGDGVRVTVFQNPDLTTEARISNLGKITVPLIGEVKLSGLTPAGAGAHIATLLKDGNYLRNPQVTVSVMQVRSRQVSVLGEVAHPGRYALDDTSSRLTDVLAQAGGMTPAGGTVVITREGKPNKIEVDLARMYRTADTKGNIEIRNGDTIYVERAPMFYIYGEVQHAGAYRLEPNMSVMQALSVGGGISPRGTDSGLKINRRGDDGKVKKLEVKLTDLVQPDDVIYVRESWF